MCRGVPHPKSDMKLKKLDSAETHIFGTKKVDKNDGMARFLIRPLDFELYLVQEQILSLVIWCT